MRMVLTYSSVVAWLSISRFIPTLKMDITIPNCRPALLLSLLVMVEPGFPAGEGIYSFQS
jgi:hypothetical protein